MDPSPASSGSRISRSYVLLPPAICAPCFVSTVSSVCCVQLVLLQTIIIPIRLALGATFLMEFDDTLWVLYLCGIMFEYLEYGKAIYKSVHSQNYRLIRFSFFGWFDPVEVRLGDNCYEPQKRTRMWLDLLAVFPFHIIIPAVMELIEDINAIPLSEASAALPFVFGMMGDAAASAASGAASAAAAAASVVGGSEALAAAGATLLSAAEPVIVATTEAVGQAAAAAAGAAGAGAADGGAATAAAATCVTLMGIYEIRFHALVRMMRLFPLSRLITCIDSWYVAGWV
jgi:hypothetical protein